VSGRALNATPRVNWKISDDQSASLQVFAQRGKWNNDTVYSNQVLQGWPSLEADNTFEGTWQNLRGNLQWNNRFSEDAKIELKLGAQGSDNHDAHASQRRPCTCRTSRNSPKPRRTVWATRT